MAVREVASLMWGEWSCYGGGQFKRENGHVTEVFSLMGREWSCYGGGQFNEGRMVILHVTIMSLEWREKCQRVMSCHVRGSEVVSLREGE